MNDELPLTQVVEQRIRNRLIEWLEMLVAYEADPPPFDLNEVLNQWEDWNPHWVTYPAPVYTPAEVEKLALVAEGWENFCNVTPKCIADEAAELQKPEWEILVSAGQTALAELQRRGRLSEKVVSFNEALRPNPSSVEATNCSKLQFAPHLER